MDDDYGERIVKLETEMCDVRKNLNRLESKIDKVDDRLDAFISNDFKHVQHSRDFWAKIIVAAVGSGGIATVVIHYLLVVILGA